MEHIFKDSCNEGMSAAYLSNLALFESYQSHDQRDSYKCYISREFGSDVMFTFDHVTVVLCNRQLRNGPAIDGWGIDYLWSNMLGKSTLKGKPNLYFLSEVLSISTG